MHIFGTRLIQILYTTHLGMYTGEDITKYQQSTNTNSISRLSRDRRTSVPFRDVNHVHFDLSPQATQCEPPSLYMGGGLLW